MGMIEDKLFIFCMFQFIKVDSKQIQATFTVCYYFWIQNNEMLWKRNGHNFMVKCRRFNIFFGYH